MSYEAKGKNRRRRGTTLVEAAIVMTLLMLVTVGAIEYGWMFVNLQRITNAARQGARVAAASGATTAEGDAEITALLGTMPVDAPPYVTTATDATTGVVSVIATVAVDSAKIGLVNWSLLPMPAKLQARVTMAKEAQ